MIDVERQQVYRGEPVRPLVVGRRETGPATVIVVGMPKGGTTATTAMLYGTGAVWMGRQSHLTRTGRFEHPDFQSPVDTWPAVARRWNARHEIWGVQAAGGEVDAWVSRTVSQPSFADRHPGRVPGCVSILG